jgi:hypothetical protein
MVLDGHPLSGTSMGHWVSWLPIIDPWLDHKDLPKPYVWPLPAKKG